MSLDFLYDIYEFWGKPARFNGQEFHMSKGDTLLQLHVSQNVDVMSTEAVIRMWVAAKSLFKKVSDIVEQKTVTYVAAATDYDLSRILVHFIPSFVPVDRLYRDSMLAMQIQRRRSNHAPRKGNLRPSSLQYDLEEDTSIFPVMLARGADFIRDAQRL